MMTRESAPQKLSRRYVHCVLRLRHRYGVEITIEEYERLCSLLATGGGERRRENERGDVEAWIEVQPGVWACACFDANEQLIRTFLPAPPERVTVSGDPRLRQALADNKALRGQVKHLQHKLAQTAEQRREGAGPLVATQSLTAVRGEDIKWFKREIQAAKSMIAEGRLLDAAIHLDAIAGLKHTDHPGAEPERFAQLVAERSAEIRPHWERLFAHLGLKMEAA